MLKDSVAVTDYLREFSIEKEILGSYFSNVLSENTTIALVWTKGINKEFLSRYSNIRALVRYGVGYDNIDIEECMRRKILVVNTPDYGIDEVSDTAISMILNLVRKINSFQVLAKESESLWRGEKIDLPIKRLNQMTLGIIGLGRIGASVARKFQSFSRNIQFYDPLLPSGVEKILGINRCFDKNTLLESSDIVSIHTPLNKDTVGMVNTNFISNMKKGSYLINVSRGGIIEDSEIIYKALKNRHLEGYGTDVWTMEPPRKEDLLYNSWLADSDFQGRIIVNPHTAYYSSESLIECRVKACKNCLNIISGKNILNKII
ncbi:MULTISPECIES: NAD(P)-dependent oxidoreductase [Prochlorococcus]|uniref:NAD(P)-dependent oxidoreductase n=1 Tax=Prochlorococcus TaxID=1218 RepID=UPI000533770A|nr:MULTISPECIES: NAD(P)-dependent oxidoreductase [Prochlorococcus]KGG12044.1 D-3-phosphoglycerate dehydrogenase [Prochlorococcus sp. MIT 0601]